MRSSLQNINMTIDAAKINTSIDYGWSGCYTCIRFVTPLQLTGMAINSIQMVVVAAKVNHISSNRNCGIYTTCCLKPPLQLTCNSAKGVHVT